MRPRPARDPVTGEAQARGAGRQTDERNDDPSPWLKKLGPGLITGAADDDPSGIATYSQAGAQFGFGMLWPMLFTFPLMAGIQLVSARIGRVTGHGLATNIRRHYPRALLHAVVGLLLVANTINIAADIAAMGEALALIVGGPPHWHAAGFGVVSLLLQVFMPYRRYVRLLKWLTLSLLAYVATVFILSVPWTEVLRAAMLPRLSWEPAYLTTVVAVFGTTISPYLFFWQASQEVEDLLADPHARPLIRAPQQAPAQLRRIHIDTWAGMAFSNLVAFFIILATALTLHAHGITTIRTAAEAALALRPIAGEFAFLLFAAGLIGTGLLAVPVLAGSSAYAMAGAMHWKNSLGRTPMQARRFYLIIVVSMLAGTLLSLSGIDAIRALYWSAVINGVISVPIMAVMMLLAARADVMGRFVISPGLRLTGWLAILVMAAAVCAMFVAG